MSTKELKLIPLSSLAKVFPTKIYGKAHRHVQAAYGQEVSFQIAYRHMHSFHRKVYEVKASTSIKRAVTLHKVGVVPSSFSAYALGRSDDNYLTKDIPESDGLLKCATYYKAGNLGIHELNTWGDYFYMEALMRFLKPDWELYW